MDEPIIFKYQGQKFVGIATRQQDNTLNHAAFTLVDAIPTKGDPFLQGRVVVEVLTHAELLKEIATQLKLLSLLQNLETGHRTSGFCIPISPAVPRPAEVMFWVAGPRWSPRLESHNPTTCTARPFSPKELARNS
jgi:hypothetical protein